MKTSDNINKYLTMRNKLLNEAKKLSRRLNNLMESSEQSELENRFNRIKNLFKDYPRTVEGAILKGFKIEGKETDRYDSDEKTRFEDASGNVVLELGRYKDVFRIYENSEYYKYAYAVRTDYKGDILDEVCNEFFYDLEEYGSPFSNYKFISITLTKEHQDKIKVNYDAFTKDYTVRSIQKPWFLSFSEKSIEKAKKMRLDLSNLSDEEF